MRERAYQLSEENLTSWTNAFPPGESKNTSKRTNTLYVGNKTPQIIDSSCRVLAYLFWRCWCCCVPVFSNPFCYRPVALVYAVFCLARIFFLLRKSIAKKGSKNGKVSQRGERFMEKTGPNILQWQYVDLVDQANEVKWGDHVVVPYNVFW